MSDPQKPVTIDAADREAHIPHTRRKLRLWPWVLGAVLLAAGAVAALIVEHR